jgi:hypothetical protein
VYLAIDDECFQFTCSEHDDQIVIVREVIPTLLCTHKESDTRIVYHLCNVLAEDPNACITIRCSDTDVLILLIYHVGPSTGHPNVWMKAEVSSNNTQHYISISQLVSHLNTGVRDALPALLALTGEGKGKPLDHVIKIKAYTEALAKLGNHKVIPTDVLALIEEYVCGLYGKPKMSNVDKVRYSLF